MRLEPPAPPEHRHVPLAINSEMNLPLGHAFAEVSPGACKSSMARLPLERSAFVAPCVQAGRRFLPAADEREFRVECDALQGIQT